MVDPEHVSQEADDEVDQMKKDADEKIDDIAEIEREGESDSDADTGSDR